MKFEKRDAAGPAPREDHNSQGGNKPVVVYIMILFIAAFLLMALSFFMHQRSNTEALGELQNSVSTMQEVQATQEKIIDLQQQMEIHSHLKITGMINNTNLATMTTPAELRDGYEMLREVSDRTGVPVMYTTGKKEMLDIFLAEGHDPKYIGKPVAIDIIMKRDWDSYIHSLSEKKQA